jgi:hypothetical protein
LAGGFASGLDDVGESVSSVMATLAWPRRALTTFTGTLALSAAVA